MSPKTTDAQKRHDCSDCTDIDKRTVRALTEVMTVLPEQGRVRGANALYLVISGSGSEYLVDTRNGSCECPDSEHRNPENGCKHVRRVRFATGERTVPAWVDPDAVADIGVHTDGPVMADPPTDAVVTDGGQPAVEGQDDIQESAPDCDCASLPDEFPCFDCFSTRDE
jgi:hypothetical protein